MKSANIHEAKTHLSRLIAAAEAGEEVVISRAGKPVVRLVAVEPAAIPDFRQPDQLAEGFWMADDMDAVEAEIAAEFNDARLLPDETPAS